SESNHQLSQLSTADGTGSWSMFSWESEAQSRLQPGHSVTFEIDTSCPVNTYAIRSWQVGAFDVGGREYFFNDGTALEIPVPVPEPSSILALAGGIAGLCGFALRRRR
ncbi:PEP-CTERM sorting domain-containing protein, partial [Thermogutta sp.]|uniref:PEP-CTERM sorting domain-containing protein n=1 Tax=Thermogutta sp. TaxID=1962930 RepID=UPI0032209240